MKFKYLFAMLLLSTSAMGSTDVDTTVAKCSIVDKGAGSDSRTSNVCATGAQLPLVRWNFDGYTLFGDMNSQDIGAEVPVSSFKLGLSGAASSKKNDGKEMHDSKASVFAKKLFKFNDSKLDVKVTASRSKVFGALRDSGAQLQLKYFFNNSELTPFAQADSTYKYTVVSKKNSLTSSFSFGVRFTVK